MAKPTKAEIAKRAIALLDLTNLSDDCTEADIDDLCARATGKHGPVAAICIWPEFIRYAKQKLKGTRIRIATVVNFPQGDGSPTSVVKMTRQAIADGAHEVDLVLPYRAFIAGDHKAATSMVKRVRSAMKPSAKLKVIIETGNLVNDALITKASRLAIDAGADFIKTSTGKVPVNATPHAAELMLQAIKASGKNVGFKPAGGIKTTRDAGIYLALADRIMGADWASPKTLRFGASGVLADLEASLEGRKAVAQKGY